MLDLIMLIVLLAMVVAAYLIGYADGRQREKDATLVRWWTSPTDSEKGHHEHR